LSHDSSSNDAPDTAPDTPAAAADKAERGKAGLWTAAGIGVGIGSAAIAAALLYANRSKGKTKA